MKLGTFIKTPVERKRYSLDYTDWLDTGETVTTCNFTVTPSGNFEIDASSIDPGGKQVVFFANYGADGSTYEVDVVMTTSGGQTKEDQIRFLVKDL